MYRFLPVMVVCLALGRTAFGTLTLDETFGGIELALGPADSGWTTNASKLVGENCG